jgi:hypothetical protein
MHIVAINAAGRQNSKTIARRRENIARAKKAKKPTVKQKTAAGTVITKMNKKTWMMLLPQPSGHGLWHL